MQSLIKAIKKNCKVFAFAGMAFFFMMIIMDLLTICVLSNTFDQARITLLVTLFTVLAVIYLFIGLTAIKELIHQKNKDKYFD